MTPPDGHNLGAIQVALARLETTVSERTKMRDAADRQLEETIRGLSGSIQGLNTTVQGLSNRVQALEGSVITGKSARRLLDLQDPQNLLLLILIAGFVLGKAGINPIDLFLK